MSRLSSGCTDSAQGSSPLGLGTSSRSVISLFGKYYRILGPRNLFSGHAGQRCRRKRIRDTWYAACHDLPSFVIHNYVHVLLAARIQAPSAGPSNSSRKYGSHTAQSPPTASLNGSCEHPRSFPRRALAGPNGGRGAPHGARASWRRFAPSPAVSLASRAPRPSADDCFLPARARRRLAWGVAGAFLGTYSVVQDLNVPLILQPQLFSLLSFVSWAQVSGTEALRVRPRRRRVLTVSPFSNPVPVLWAQALKNDGNRDVGRGGRAFRRLRSRDHLRDQGNVFSHLKADAAH